MEDNTENNSQWTDAKINCLFCGLTVQMFGGEIYSTSPFLMLLRRKAVCTKLLMPMWLPQQLIQIGWWCLGTQIWSGQQCGHSMIKIWFEKQIWCACSLNKAWYFYFVLTKYCKYFSSPVLFILWPIKTDSGDSYSPQAADGQTEDDDGDHPLMAHPWGAALQSLERSYVSKKTKQDIWRFSFRKQQQTLPTIFFDIL